MYIVSSLRKIRRAFFQKNSARLAVLQPNMKNGGAMSQDHSAQAAPGSVVSQHWLGLERIRMYSVAMLLVYGGLLLIWGLRTKGFTADSLDRPGVDFSAFWSASYLAMKGQALRAYDYEVLQPVIAAFGAARGNGSFFLPWVYPPTFLLLVMPLSVLPFAVSYLIFIGGTAALYIAAVLRIFAASDIPRHAVWLPVLAFPGVHEAAMLGQNSLLTAGMASWAMIHLKARPVLSGVLIGLLSVKPQLMVMLPMALVVDRAWTALGSAAATAAMLMASCIAFWGWESVAAFLDVGTHFRQTVLERGEIGWRSCPTVFAMMRMAGASVAAAYAGHFLCAVLAIAVLLKVWHGRNSLALRIAVVAASSLLVSPYLWHYELTWMGVAIAGLAVDGVRRGWMSGEQELLLVAWLLPLVLSLNHQGYFPQFGPLIMLLLLIAILRRA
ncbi:glycosyltransferase family 87 protein [Cupriavidus sp. Agwp_2]|uniref:glycosyltransferase family 87 protein n=1 Tax=Cupriavidus sp. Agwp_2 TaxID=2897324 RepID=UPI0034604428